MRHRHLQRPPRHRARALHPIIQTPDILPRDDLSQAAVLRIPHLDEVGVEEDQVRAVHGGRLGLADELEDDAARDLAVLVDVHAAVLVAEEELGVGEAEHAERPRVSETLGYGRDVGLVGIGDAHRDLLV